VTTVVASLLPLMWSTRPGAEVMRPLAAPVLGGMVSSLLHVLVVTPVIFFWVRERALRREGVLDAAADGDAGLASDGPALRPAGAGRRVAAGVAVLAVVAGGWWLLGERNVDPADTAATVMTVDADGLSIALRSPSGVLRQGRAEFLIEFLDARSGERVDVSDVHLAAAMPMPGMAMSAGARADRVGPGLYTVVADFGMAGAWRMSLDWTGPAGPSSVTFSGDVQ
jgi:Cu(I)/Ag(I) efflux system membrane protein CusA/SilA